MFLRVFIDFIYQMLRTRNDVVIVPYNSSLIELRRGYALFRQPQTLYSHRVQHLFYLIKNCACDVKRVLACAHIGQFVLQKCSFIRFKRKS